MLSKLGSGAAYISKGAVRMTRVAGKVINACAHGRLVLCLGAVRDAMT